MSERELAERLGVSRTSVRQALTALEVMGLVRIRHGGGVFLARAPDAVLPSLATELADRYEHLPAVMEVREAIETQTARLAARRRDDDDLRAMREAVGAMEAAIDSGAEAALSDAEFHTAVVRAARNPLLERLWADPPSRSIRPGGRRLPAPDGRRAAWPGTARSWRRSGSATKTPRPPR
jgi:GntR family transcriptional repressor for pyruvate dehydrogenase complex